MNFDKRLTFCCEQAITGTANSENIIELGKNDVSICTPVPLFTVVDEAFNNLTSLKILIQTCANSTFASDAVNTIYEEVIERAKLTADAIIGPKFLPKGAKNFARMRFEVTGSNPTTGKITAGVVDALHEDYNDLEA